MWDLSFQQVSSHSRKRTYKSLLNNDTELTEIRQHPVKLQNGVKFIWHDGAYASWTYWHNAEPLAQGEIKTKSDNQVDVQVCVKGSERRNHKRCLVCGRVVCSQCLPRAGGQILERRKAPPGAVSPLWAFIPKQCEKLGEVRKDGLWGFLPACGIW